jgi:hypothetical protein
MGETLGLVDRSPIGERNHRADAGRGHQPPTHRIVSDRIEQHLVERGQLLAHHPTHRQQRLDDRRQPRKTLRLGDQQNPAESHQGKGPFGELRHVSHFRTKRHLRDGIDG